MHCHSTASELSKLGIQRSLSLPECATPPEEVYELAKRRGMDFVTITDHDTIAGALTLDHLPDVFISEELTVWFKGEPQAVHVLCYGITPDDHDWLQAHIERRRGVRGVPSRQRDHGCTCAPLLRRRGAADRPSPPAARAAVPDLGDAQRLARQGAEPAGVRVHRDPRGHGDRRLRRPRRNRYRSHVHRNAARGDARRVSGAHPGGPRGRTRSAGQRREVDARRDGARDPRARPRRGRRPRPIRRAVLKIVERVMREGDVRHGDVGTATSAPTTRSRCCVRGSRRWTSTSTSVNLLELLQEGELSHPDLYRRARRIHERKLADAVHEIVAMTDERRARPPARRARAVRRVRAGDPVRGRDARSSGARSPS